MDIGKGWVYYMYENMFISSVNSSKKAEILALNASQVKYFEDWKKRWYRRTFTLKRKTIILINICTQIFVRTSIWIYNFIGFFEEHHQVSNLKILHHKLCGQLINHCNYIFLTRYIFKESSNLGTNFLLKLSSIFKNLWKFQK